MRTLRKTIAGVVRNMKPAMICMSEVGGASVPLTKEQMQQVADQTMHAWGDAVAEHVGLHCMFQCCGHRIFTDLYPAQGQPRTT